MFIGCTAGCECTWAAVSKPPIVRDYHGEWRLLDDVQTFVNHLNLFSPDPTGSREESNCSTLAGFLTRCIAVCHNALDEQEEFPDRQYRWYNDLEFVVGSPAVKDFDDAATFGPGILGGGGVSTLKGEQPCLSSANNLTHGIVLPVKVEKGWRNMVSQATTYGRNLFARSPIRVFTLILAFNQDSKELGFLIPYKFLRRLIGNYLPSVSIRVVYVRVAHTRSLCRGWSPSSCSQTYSSGTHRTRFFSDSV